METPKTDKTRIYKGLQKVFISIPLMFTGPVVIYSSFKNEGNILYYPVLIAGCMICLYSMFLFFKGLRTIVSGLFND